MVRDWVSGFRVGLQRHDGKVEAVVLGIRGRARYAQVPKRMSQKDDTRYPMPSNDD